MIALAGLVVLGLIGFRYARRGEADLRRITRLNNILRAIQNINQLAVRERDSRNLLTQAGKILVDALGFRRVLAVQTDSSCRVVHAACSGSALPADQAGQLQEGQPIPVAWASCLERAEVHIGTQPAPGCAGCPAADAAEGVVLCSRLAHAGNVHGLMSIELAAKALPDHEDVAMLSELAGDIALAIDDIEQQKSLAKERRFIQTVLDATGALIAVLDREGRVSYVNRACEEVTGYRMAEIRGKLLWDVLIHPADAKSLQAVFADLKAGNFPCTHTNPWQTKDGQRREVEWLNTALTDEQGEVEYVIKAGIDVTERKRAAVKRDLAAAERAQFEAGYRDLIERGHAIVYHAPPEGPDQVPSYVSPQITAPGHLGG
jgi:PAS domain S-box-containing protein